MPTDIFELQQLYVLDLGTMQPEPFTETVFGVSMTEAPERYILVNSQGYVLMGRFPYIDSMNIPAKDFTPNCDVMVKLIKFIIHQRTQIHSVMLDRDNRWRIAMQLSANPTVVIQENPKGSNRWTTIQYEDQTQEQNEFFRRGEAHAVALWINLVRDAANLFTDERHIMHLSKGL